MIFVFSLQFSRYHKQRVVAIVKLFAKIQQLFSMKFFDAFFAAQDGMGVAFGKAGFLKPIKGVIAGMIQGTEIFLENDIFFGNEFSLLELRAERPCPSEYRPPWGMWGAGVLM